MITKEDVAKFGNRLSNSIATIGANIKENQRKRTIQRVLDKVDMSNSDNVNTTIANLMSLDAPNLAGAIQNYYKSNIEAEQSAFKQKKEEATNQVTFDYLKQTGTLDKDAKINKLADYSGIKPFKKEDKKQFAMKQFQLGGSILPATWDYETQQYYVIIDGVRKPVSEVGALEVTSKPPSTSYNYSSNRSINTSTGDETFVDDDGNTYFRDKVTRQWRDSENNVIKKPPKKVMKTPTGEN